MLVSKLSLEKLMVSSIQDGMMRQPKPIPTMSSQLKLGRLIIIISNIGMP